LWRRLWRKRDKGVSRGDPEKNDLPVALTPRKRAESLSEIKKKKRGDDMGKVKTPIWAI